MLAIYFIWAGTKGLYLIPGMNETTTPMCAIFINVTPLGEANMLGTVSTLAFHDEMVWTECPANVIAA